MQPSSHRVIVAIALVALVVPAVAAPPNILLMMTDDQGWGDLHSHGNEILKTPNLDRLAAESVEFTQFVVAPNCSPTRASLMTGRYHYRTGVTEVTRGRHMVHADEITIAEILKDAGYATGIFGKWHLGDVYPMRPTDQGFDEALVHKAGGIGQAGGPPGNSYFDPWLEHNDERKQFKGYCDDIFADAAIRFIEENREKPFFAYYATNLPHFPLDVPDSRADPYRRLGIHEHNARTFGMIENIDANVGRMLAKLDELGLRENTIVVFLSDNGPRTRRTKNDVYPDRFVAGLRGTKTSVYENGIRVPFFIRWPAKFKGGRNINTMAAHIDVLPTLVEAAGLKQPSTKKIDGLSLMPLVAENEPAWPDRTLYFQWHSGPVPFQYIHFAARKQRYKLIQPQDDPHAIIDHPTDAELSRFLKTLELYDIEADPSELDNLASKRPEIVEQMLTDYEDWFADVTSERDFHEPERIHIGTAHQNPLILSRFDWRGPRASTQLGGWDQQQGHWEIRAEEGEYKIRLRHAAAKSDGVAHLRFKGFHATALVDKNATATLFESVKLPGGPGRFEAYLKLGRLATGVHYVDVERID